MDIKLRCTIHGDIVIGKISRAAVGDRYVETCPKCLKDAKTLKPGEVILKEDEKPPIIIGPGYIPKEEATFNCYSCGKEIKTQWVQDKNLFRVIPCKCYKTLIEDLPDLKEPLTATQVLKDNDEWWKLNKERIEAIHAKFGNKLAEAFEATLSKHKWFSFQSKENKQLELLEKIEKHLDKLSSGMDLAFHNLHLDRKTE
jgi:hypothetical protein